MSAANISQHMNSANKGADEPTNLPRYSPPQKGILSLLPASWVPYGELARIDKPTGIYLFYFPHLFGTLYARSLPGSDKTISVWEVMKTNIVLLLGTVFMRAAACAWNDNLDKEYDRRVRRCMLRPIARGAVSPLRGHIFTAVMTAGALAFLFQFPRDFGLIATPSIALLVLYPFAKRFTDFPQLILGFQVGIAFFLGIAAVGYDFKLLLRHPQRHQSVTAMAAFYLACVSWTVIYDTIYAQQDINDDIKAGVKSMAIRFKDDSKTLLAWVITLKITLLILAGTLQGMGFSFFALGCGVTCFSLMYMAFTINLQEPAECWWWFQNNCWVVGIPIALGLAFEADWVAYY